MKGVYDPSECNALVKYLLQERLQWSFSALSQQGDQGLQEQMVHQLKNDLSRLKQGEPIQHVLGYAWFNDLKLMVDKNVLIPRPETEELVAFIQDYTLPPESVILDLCTGSGCIAIALKCHYPESMVYGADMSGEALQIARKNSEALNLDITFFYWDVLKMAEPEIDMPMADVIVSNPPYIQMEEISEMHQNVSEYEPHLALFVPDNEPLLFYESITAIAVRKLKKEGRLWFEINRQYGDEVGNLLEKNGFSDIRIYQDISENDRFVSAVR